MVTGRKEYTEVGARRLPELPKSGNSQNLKSGDLLGQTWITRKVFNSGNYRILAILAILHQRALAVNCEVLGWE